MDRKPLFGSPQGCGASASEAFRTVSPRTRVNKGQEKGRSTQAPARSAAPFRSRLSLRYLMENHSSWAPPPLASLIVIL